MAAPTPKPSTTPHLDTVDVLRGLSILAVVLLHGYLRMVLNDVPLKGTLPRWLLHLLFLNGGNGVTVFFAVSGFLITLTSIRRFGGLGYLRLPTFYRIRFARIGPPLLLTLAVLSLLHLLHADGFRIPASSGGLLRALFAALTFHLNWLEAAKGYLPANWDVLWTLSVEEMFYLFFPLLCVALLRPTRGKGALYVFVAILFGFVIASPFAKVLPTNEIWQEKSYLGGMGAIALGCLTALLADWLQRAKHVPSLAVLRLLQIAGVTAVLLIAFYPRLAFMRFLGRTGLDDTLLSLGACAVMLVSVLHNRPGSRWSAPVRWFGRHSYEVYLTHEFVIVWLTAAFLARQKTGQPTGSPLLWLAAMLLAAAPLGWLLARFWAIPLNRRLRPHRTG